MRCTLLALLPLLLVLGCLGPEVQNGKALPMGNATVALPDGTLVKCEVPLTSEGMEQGLMYREGLCGNCGMLFMFKNSGNLEFWMKNMKFPIDIVFLDKDWKVVRIARDAPPCPEEPCAVYSSQSMAKYVLELDANETIAHGIVVGSKIRRID